MFSSTAYEAFYTYIGMYLHQESIKIITSQEFFIGLMALIIGCTLMLGTWKYFSSFMPGFFGLRQRIGIGFFFKAIACAVMGISLLKIATNERIRNFSNESWHKNSYITSRMSRPQETYQVSFIFDLLVKAAEEIAKYANIVVDSLFKKTNSQLDAPAAFYKAILFAGAQTLDDPQLKDQIDVYTKSCFDKILPLMGEAKKQDKLKEFFRENGIIDRELELIPILTESGKKISCLDLKNQLRRNLWKEAQIKGAKFRKNYAGSVSINKMDYVDNFQNNMIASSALLNHYVSKTEDSFGTQKGAQVQGTMAKFLMKWDRFFSFDGFMNVIGQGDQVGSVLTAKRAGQFSEYLQRAPHLKGIVKLALIVVFPWLVFFVVAGRWKVIGAWFAIYFSVQLWTPIWTLLYHLMTSIALSNELMAEFGNISDGISLYSSSFITNKIYQFYAIYASLQLLLGPLPTLYLTHGIFTSILRDSERESLPSVGKAALAVGMMAVAKTKAIATKKPKFRRGNNNE